MTRRPHSTVALKFWAVFLAFAGLSSGGRASSSTFRRRAASSPSPCWPAAQGRGRRYSGSLARALPGVPCRSCSAGAGGVPPTPAAHSHSMTVLKAETPKKTVPQSKATTQSGGSRERKTATHKITRFGTGETMTPGDRETMRPRDHETMRYHETVRP